MNIKSYFPRFKGITDIIPGHLYEDEKGVEIIFVGFGAMHDYMKNDEGTYNSHSRWGQYKSFLYIKKKKLDNAINKKEIDYIEKFTVLANQLMIANKGDILEYFNFSQRPRKFMKDLGEYFPQNINPELLEIFETDKYEHDFDSNCNHSNINGSNCRFGNYWIFDFKQEEL